MQNNAKKNQRLLNVDDFGVSMLKRNIVFFCFLSMLGLLYIANSHLAEKKIRNITALKAEIKELNWKYLSLQSDLMQNSIYSSVQAKLSSQDLGLRGAKPTRILTSDYK